MRNPVKNQGPYKVAAEAKAIYGRLNFMADLHCDALRWGRERIKRGARGHVDFAGMREANVGLEMFTIVSKSLAGQNMKRNNSDAVEDVTLLTIAKDEGRWNWFSLINRTISQSEDLAGVVSDDDEKAIFVTSKADLEKLIQVKKSDEELIGAMSGIEGGNAPKRKIENLDIVYNAGVRMIGPTHFSNNKFGGSAHSETEKGLTDFGKAAIELINELEILVDLAHVSPAIVEDVLNLSSDAVIVSHTSVRAGLNSQPNLEDLQIKKIAGNCRIIAIAFFEMAVGEPEPPNIIASIRHIRDPYVALGSDFDGWMTVLFELTSLPLIVQDLLNAGFKEEEVAV